MSALATLVILLWVLCIVVRMAESALCRGLLAELRRMWIAAGIPGRVLAVLVLFMCVQSAGSKGVTPVQSLFRLLFWAPGSSWQLAAPASAVDGAQASLARAEADLADVDTVASSNDVVTISFDWHAPARLPYHERQNVLAWTAQVVPTNINGTLYEDHYIAFNASASTNPAVILIEYAKRRDNGTVERYSSAVVTNSYPDTSVVDLQSGSHTCYWFRCPVPPAFTAEVRDWNGEALFGSPSGSGRGFDLLGTLVIDDGDDIWVGATTNIVFDGSTNEFRNGINIAASSKKAGPVTLTFEYASAYPATITIGGTGYGQPADPSKALVDAGDGVFVPWTSNTITVKGKRIRFRGDWRNASGNFRDLFTGTFGGGHNVTMSGGFDFDGAPAANIFRSTFQGCSNLTGSIPVGLFGDISGAPVEAMFDSTFYNCSNLTGSIPSGLFCNISGTPAAYMFNGTFRNCSKLTGESALMPDGTTHLYDQFSTASGNTCDNCYLSATGLDDYATMPAAWK